MKSGYGKQYFGNVSSPCMPEKLDSDKDGLYCTSGHYLTCDWGEHLKLESCPSCNTSLRGVVLLINGVKNLYG
jgi:hypothetical protein